MCRSALLNMRARVRNKGFNLPCALLGCLVSYAPLAHAMGRPAPRPPHASADASRRPYSARGAASSALLPLIILTQQRPVASPAPSSRRPSRRERTHRNGATCIDEAARPAVVTTAPGAPSQAQPHTHCTSKRRARRRRRVVTRPAPPTEAHHGRRRHPHDR